MNTPIYDFVKKYNKSDTARFHMPGHKGSEIIGVEGIDITEIKDGDYLYCPEGIIKESEKNASLIFKSGETFYSTEGSSLSIKVMLYVAKSISKKKYIIASRNVHKSFIYACGLLDIDVLWIYPENSSAISGGTITKKQLECMLSQLDEMPMGVYVTSPNYLGEITDIEKIGRVTRKFNVPLLVDNAHGAYLSALGLHPIDLGADMCCDSAHKTLPVLTGGGYLHICSQWKNKYTDIILQGFSMFGSTSPSYVILSSLDMCNKILKEGFSDKLEQCIKKIDEIKDYAIKIGIPIAASEPLKLVIDCSFITSTGVEIGEFFRNERIEPEYCDDLSVVLMASPFNSEVDYERLKNALSKIIILKASKKHRMVLSSTAQKLSIREALFSDSEVIDTFKSIGRICSDAAVTCPPAIPIAVCGEIITDEICQLLLAYNIKKIRVVQR